MSEKRRPMTDQELMVKVNAKVKEAVGWYDSRLSKERQRTINYYNGVLPKRQHLGSSPYISTDVYDSVQSMVAQLVETFAANPDNLVSFPPNGPNDVEQCRIATEWCNHVFFARNNGLSILEHAAHDGLMARVAVAKVHWEKKNKDVEEEVPAGLSYQDVMALAAQEDVSEFEAEADPNSPDPQNPTFLAGRLTRSEDISYARVQMVPPEEFLISPRCYTIEDADATCHRTLKYKSELIEMGYDRKKVMEVHYDDDMGLDMGPEVLARNMPVETTQALQNPIQDEQQKVMLYESYVRIDLHDGRGTRLYKIVHVNETLFEKEEVDRAPFKVFTPLPIPYLFYGNNFAARLIPYQNARTVLTRAILDHAAITTNPRWGVVKGGLLNPRELIENRLGGVLNLTRPDAVEALQQQNLNPYVFQLLETLKSNKEESTGISQLSQGLNKDAISTQNSAALVDNLVALSQIRQKIIARNFARFIADVYLEIYRLTLENQDEAREEIIEVAGNFAPISTKAWIERSDCSIALHLGYGERDREVAKYEALYKNLSGDPAIGPMFTSQNRYNLIVDAMKTGGFQNFAKYITPPQQTQPPKPDPLKVQELQIRDKEAQAALMTAGANQQKVQVQAQNDQVKQQLEELNLHLKSLLGMRAEVRKDAEVKSRIEIADREMTMLEKHPPTKETGTVAA